MTRLNHIENLFGAAPDATKQDWRAVGLVAMILPLLAVMVFSMSVGSTPSVAMAEDDTHAETAASTRTPGNLVMIRITGELAKEYYRRTNTSAVDKPTPSGLEIGTSASIEQILDDGRYRIEHSARINGDKKSPRLVTLIAIVNPTQFQIQITPKNTPIFRSPVDQNPVLSKSDSKHEFIELSDLKGIKLQTWVLKEEIGE